MATQIKRRRGTTSEVSAFTPAVAEWVQDTIDNSLHIGDGFTLGGHRIPVGVEFTTDIGTIKHPNIPVGFAIRSEFFSNVRVAESDATWYFSGTTTPGKAGNVPNADGSVYDDDGKQFSLPNKFTTKQMGAVPGGVVDNSTTLQTALTYFLSLSEALLILSPGSYLCNTGLTLIFTTLEISGKAITGYGCELISGVSSGDFWLIDAQAEVRNLTIDGVKIRGGAGEDIVLHLDGGAGGSSEFLYGMNFNDIHLEGFSGDGWKVENNSFESAWFGCSARTTNTTGICMLFDNGASGAVSSINLISCITSGGLKGVHVISPVSDVVIEGGTYILAQEEGIRLENNLGHVINSAHIENNWEGAANIAAGQAGLQVNGTGVINGVVGTTNSKQKYVVGVFVTADQVSTVIGGSETGDTIKYLSIDGASGANAGTVNLLSHLTVDFLQNDVRLNRFSADGIQLGEGATNDQGKWSAKSDVSGFENIMHRWVGSGDNYYAYRWKDTAFDTMSLQSSPSHTIGAEVWTTLFTVKQNGTMSFFGASPIAKPEVTGARDDGTALADLLTDLESLGLITDSTTAS